MDKIAVDFKKKGVVFYNLYTREPHPGEDTSRRSKDKRYDFTEKKQTKTQKQREDYAEGMLKDFNQVRPVMIDIFGKDCVQNWLGGGAPNSLAVIDRDGKLVLWQTWAKDKPLRAKLEEMTGTKKKK